MQKVLMCLSEGLHLVSFILCHQDSLLIAFDFKGHKTTSSLIPCDNFSVSAQRLDALWMKRRLVCLLIQVRAWCVYLLAIHVCVRPCLLYKYMVREGGA